MQFGIRLPSFGEHAARDAIMDVAQAADELGYYSAWAAERLLVPEPPNQGWSRIDPGAYEPLITLAFVAGMTERIKLGTNIVIAPLRKPLVLARQATALDRLSRGRLILGLGLGWMEEEFRASGIPMRERGARTDETIRLLRTLWTDSSPSFEGRFTAFPPSHFEPKPHQQPVPIWIGGTTDAALARVARLGDGWTPTSVGEDQLENRISVLRREMQAHERSMDEVVVSYDGPFGGADDVTPMIERLRGYRRLGIRHFIPRFRNELIDDFIEQMRVFAAEVMPALVGDA